MTRYTDTPTFSLDDAKLQAALRHIAAQAHAALGERCATCTDHGHQSEPSDEGIVLDSEPLSCTPKALPARLQLKAAQTASRINPVNAPAFSNILAAGVDARVMEPARAAVLTAKYWGPRPRQLTVSFMETTPADLRARILAHMNAWTTTGGISFVYTAGTGQVRISRGSGGYYSYLGTDVLLIPRNRQTMNLEGFTMNTPESEYKRVVRHETGHTLGCPHEHMRKALVDRIDPQKAYAYFLRTQGWDKAMVDSQVLTPLEERSLMATPPDQMSIMCYQLPGAITRDGRPIVGGLDINASDYAFIGKIYPKLAAGRAELSSLDQAAEIGARGATPSFNDDWDPADDVQEVEDDLL
ncbi:MAG: peptidase M12 [Cyanobacteriota bacterium]|nr:peptidase M12 [Cyanobacteriota bacterium]